MNRGGENIKDVVVFQNKQYYVGTVVKITERSNVYFYWLKNIPNEFEYNKRTFEIENKIKEGYLQIHGIDDHGSLICRGYPPLEICGERLVPIYKDEIIRIATDDEFVYITLQDYVNRPVGLDKFEISIILSMIFGCGVTIIFNNFGVVWSGILIFGLGSFFTHRKLRKKEIKQRRMLKFNNIRR